MLFDFLLLLGGLLLIIKGGEWFVAAAVHIAELLRMPRVIIGSTLVSLATTMPELTVSIMAGLKGESELAIGNAVGSVACNIGLVLGVTAAFRSVPVHRRALALPLTVMGGLGLLLTLMTLNLRLSRLHGGILLTLGVAYFAWDFLVHLRNRKPRDEKEAAAVAADTGAHRGLLRTRAGTAAQFLVGALVVVFGSRWLVEGAVNVSGRMGVPPIVVGLTIVGIGTSMPEFVTAVTSLRRNVSDLSIGNVIGANVANLSLIVGTAALLSDVRIDRASQLFNFPAMLVMMGLLIAFLMSGERVTRREGATLLGAYLVYLTALLVLTLRAH